MAYLGSQTQQIVKILISNLKGKVDRVDDLQNIESPQNADLYIVEENRHGYIYDAQNKVWIDLGEIKGERGEKGEQGEFGAVLGIEPITLNDTAGSYSVYRIIATNKDGGIKTIEFKVFNGKDGIVAINDNSFSEDTVWSSYKTRKEILMSLQRIPSYVAAMLF